MIDNKQMDLWSALQNSEFRTPNSEFHKEGELYRVVTTFGKTFELRYGYYGEQDRQNPLCKPTVIYPDFLSEPVYTEEGTPFVTMIQDACKSYRGEAKRTPDTTCAECKYFWQGEEWFGLCACAKNKKPTDL